MSYQREEGESTEQYVDRIRDEAAAGTISSGPGGSLVQHAIDQARGFGTGSGGQPENRSQSVSDNFWNSLKTSPIYKAGSANQKIYGSGSTGFALEDTTGQNGS